MSLVVVAQVARGNKGSAQTNCTLQVPVLVQEEATSGRPSGYREGRASENSSLPCQGPDGPQDVGMRGKGIPPTPTPTLKGSLLSSWRSVVAWSEAGQGEGDCVLGCEASLTTKVPEGWSAMGSLMERSRGPASSLATPQSLLHSIRVSSPCTRFSEPHPKYRPGTNPSSQGCSVS